MPVARHSAFNLSGVAQCRRVRRGPEVSLTHLHRAAHRRLPAGRVRQGPGLHAEAGTAAFSGSFRGGAHYSHNSAVHIWQVRD